MNSDNALSICWNCFAIVGSPTDDPPHEQLHLVGTTYFGRGSTGVEVNDASRFECHACGSGLIRDRNPAAHGGVWTVQKDICVMQ